MSSRLLCSAIVRLQLRNAQKLKLTQRHINERLWPAADGSCSLGRVQPLHMKIYDTDVKLTAQREVNKDKSLEESYLQTFEEEPAVPTTREKLQRMQILDRKQRAERANNIGEMNQQKPKAKELMVSIEDSETFGNAKIHTEEDAGDLAEEDFIRNPIRRSKQLQTKDYSHIIKEHLNANRLTEAIDVLEQRMLKDDRVKPENYIYNLLISGCGKAGFTRKAFSLFTKMRNRGLTITGGTYTSLFNACANAPSSVDGLSRANHLREVMIEKGYVPNVTNYNAMIKAYGRCGDVKTAYLLADEMMDRQLQLNTDTFNFLLQACASDADFGFRHCLLTWHKMMKRGVQPDYYSFNIILRCVRDSGFGDIQTMQDVLQQILTERSIVHIDSDTQIKLPNVTAKPKLDADTNEVEPLNQQGISEQSLQLTNESTHFEIPNLLASRPHLGSMVSLAEVNLPHERLLLLGGLSGYLEVMKHNNVTPDIKTFTTMLEVIPPTNAAEKQVISFIRRIGLKADIDFFNVLIKKRSTRFDYESAKEVLSMIRTAGLHPDIVTYGVLALGCRTEDAARELLQQMRINGVRMNIQILGAMLRQGCAQKIFPYVTAIMQISLDEHIKPNDIFLKHLNNFYNSVARAIDSRHPGTKSKSFRNAHAKFCDKLRMYKEEHGISGLKLEDAINKIKERPYQQYKETKVDGMEPLKNQTLARKQKLRKYIKKIKVENLRNDEEIEFHRPKRIE